MFKKLFNNEAGVSPIVATLVLVVVAIAGAAAVGTIMGSFSSDVSDQASADTAATGASTELIVAGSTTVQPVSELIAKEYMANNPGVKITVQGGGSDAGIASAGMGIVDIGAASKFMGDSSKTKFPELEQHTIGGSAVVVITNAADPANATATVSQMAMEAIYDDDATTVNATVFDNNIIVVQRSEGSGTEETFARWARGDSKLSDTDDTKANNVNGSLSSLDNEIGNQGVLDKVATTANAIGFVDYGFAKDDDRVIILPISETKAGTVTATGDNVKAAVKDVLAGNSMTTTSKYEYALCRPLVYLTNGETSSMVNNYLNFAMSPAALECFHDAGYYGITELQ
ncbi:MAG: phosphate transport system substrate-binding protein [Methanolobus sp.]|nr:phosphate transport system substrate-binding protein [Methanolobus sp.]